MDSTLKTILDMLHKQGDDIAALKAQKDATEQADLAKIQDAIAANSSAITDLLTPATTPLQG